MLPGISAASTRLTSLPVKLGGHRHPYLKHVSTI
jgi:hypothetical protein